MLVRKPDKGLKREVQPALHVENRRSMRERTSSQPTLRPRTVSDKAARGERLAAEMRKNLMKRKRQQREKSEDGEKVSVDESHPNDGA